MKKLTTLIATIGLAAIISGCTSEPSIASATKLDLNTVCSVEKSGIKSVIETAAKYNKVAQAKGLEFRRLGVNNSALITSVEEAIKTDAKEVNPKDFKGKTSKTKLETNFAAERACRFAVVALIQADEAKSTWRDAVPGDGLKY
jgi:predicted component of type VI protein secretion system